MPNPPPTNIGGYDILRAIGQGGMGTLYLAWDPELDREIAIKLLKEDDEEQRERFSREAKAVAKLTHPNIVTIYRFGSYHDSPFIAMEFVVGDTLAEIIRMRRRLSTIQKLELMEDLSDGLDYAHVRGIIHRDVKPANLMVEANGNLKILDFGIARTAQSDMTKKGVLIGTLNYMSPEQMKGLAVDKRSDIFSVGVVFYELLSYRHAFPGGLMDGVVNNVLHEQPPSLGLLLPDLGSDVIRIVERAMEKDPVKRYQDLAAMRKDIQSARARLELSAAPTVQVAREALDSDSETKPVEREVLAQSRDIEIRRYLEQAETALQAGDDDAATAACEQALLLDGVRSETLALRERARQAHDRRQVQEWLTKARDEIERGALTAAGRLLEQTAALDPSSPKLADLRRALDQALAERLRAHERAAAMRQLLERARTLVDQGQFIQAAAAADEALALDTNSSDARALKAQAAEKERVRAVEVAQRERQLRITQALELARAEVAKQAFKAAIDRLHAVREADGSTPEIAALLGEAERGQAAADRAREMAERAAVHLERASNLREQNDLPAALAEIDAALALRPDHEPARRAREQIEDLLQEAKAEREAEERLKREREETVREAIRQAKRSASHENAIHALIEAQRLDPTNDQVRRMLDVEIHANEREQAEKRHAQQIEAARLEVEALIDRSAFDEAERAMRRAETELNAKRSFKPQWERLKGARAAALKQVHTTTDTVVDDLNTVVIESDSPPQPVPPRLDRKKQVAYFAGAAAVVIALAGTSYLVLAKRPPKLSPGPSSIQDHPPIVTTAPASSTIPATTTTVPFQPPLKGPGPTMTTVPVDPNVLRIQSLVAIAGQEYSAGNRERALQRAREGLGIRPGDASMSDLLKRWYQDALSEAKSAREAADGAGTRAIASQNYADATQRLNDAQRQADSGKLADALPPAWEATNDFKKAVAEPPPQPISQPVSQPIPPVLPATGSGGLTAGGGGTPPPEKKGPDPEPKKRAPEEEIQGLLNDYAAAESKLSVDDVAKTYPTINKAQVQKDFSEIKSQVVTVQPCKIVLSAATVATAQCTMHASWQGKSGGTQRQNNAVTFQLARSGDQWAITSITYK